MSTTPKEVGKRRLFQVNHPFHPLYRREFELIDHRRCWGHDRVFYLDEQRTLRSLPTSWTSAAVADAFVTVAAGRAAFRVTDLLALADLLKGTAGGSGSNDGEEGLSCGC